MVRVPEGETTQGILALSTIRSHQVTPGNSKEGMILRPGLLLIVTHFSLKLYETQ